MEALTVGATHRISPGGDSVRTVGYERLQAEQAYLFMANHTSNLDPPIITGVLGRHISIMTKQELFKFHSSDEPCTPPDSSR